MFITVSMTEKVQYYNHCLQKLTSSKYTKWSSDDSHSHATYGTIINLVSG